MKACLREVNDTSSRIVGQAFFNVLEAPCFEFSYEEQCVERHWYGVCKLYDKVPVAVLRESIPYDFGGIDVIDELPLPPLGKIEEPGSEPEKTTEGAGTTQSTASSSSSSSSSSSASHDTTPEAPSLTNMVTAAEDFIKVLATVSTSQGSSSPDAAKEETQGSEKKRKKNAGGKRRKNKRRRGKGKGRKRRPHVEAVVKTDEGAVGAPSCHVPEEVRSQINVVDDPTRSRQAEGNVDNFMRSEADLEAKEELSNTMMRDEPQRSAGAASTNTPVETVKDTELEKDKDSDESPFSPSTPPASTVNMGIIKSKTHRGRLRLGQKRQRHILRALTSSSDPKPHANTEGDQSITTSDSEGTSGEREQAEAAGQPRSDPLGNASEEGPVATTARAPATNPLQGKRQRSKERVGRKRAGKVIPPFTQAGPPQTESKGEEEEKEEQIGGVTPVLSATEVSPGYHVVPKRLDYLSARRVVPSTVGKPEEPSGKSKRQWSRESRERRVSGHIFGTTFTPGPTPTSAAQTVQYPDKADYEVMVTAGASATSTTTTTTTIPSLSDTSTLAQLRPNIKDTSTQDTQLFLLTGIPPGGTHKPKRRQRQEGREGRRRRKLISAVLSE